MHTISIRKIGDPSCGTINKTITITEPNPPALEIVQKETITCFDPNAIVTVS